MDEELEITSNHCKYCIYSSFVFLTNVVAGIYFKQYLYAFLFLFLTYTSIVHHSSRTPLTNILDKIALYFIIFYGGYKFYTNVKNQDQIYLKNILKYIFIVTTFISVVYLYLYGYLTNNYVFHPEYKIAQLYHVLMHLVSSFGHHIIIAL